MQHYKSTFLIAVAATILFSCESTLKDVQRMSVVEFSPVGHTENINLKYTDSGKVKAILISPLMLDYSHLEYGFNEFPKGVHVTLLEGDEGKSFVESDYAITYAKTDIIDLQGNVKITSAEGAVLETEQLFYDQKNEWFYTEKTFKFTDGKGGFLTGPGIDFSKDFSVMNAQHNTGQINNVD